MPSPWYAHKIPPPAIDAACAALMWQLARSVPAGQLWPPAGGALALAGVWAFARSRTTVNPLAPQRARALVTGGVYRYTRNPMYLGMLLALAGWAVWLGNAAALLALPLFVAVLNTLQIRPEEAALRARFGADYARYAQRVRRWA